MFIKKDDFKKEKNKLLKREIKKKLFSGDSDEDKNIDTHTYTHKYMGTKSLKPKSE